MAARTIKVKCPMPNCDLIRSDAAIMIHLRKKHGVGVAG